MALGVRATTARIDGRNRRSTFILRKGKLSDGLHVAALGDSVRGTRAGRCGMTLGATLAGSAGSRDGIPPRGAASVTSVRVRGGRKATVLHGGA